MTITEIFESMPYGPAPEGADLANAWLDAHDRKFGHFIGGEWVRASSTFESFNPATTKKIAEIGQGTLADIDAAVKAATEGQATWWAMSAHARGKCLYAIARQIQKHARLFSVLETMDNGKPIRETRDLDIPLVVRHFYYHAGWAQLMSSEFPDFEPLGVCGQIIPWNFPLLMLSWKIAPALAMGNSVILKPAEYTSLSALLFAEICERAGVPAGVVNIVTGDGETGKAIVEHPGINKIAFTGSTEVGRILRKATAGTGKKLSLELGGKSPFIVFEDADLDSTVEGIVDAIWFNQGQVCCAGSRLLVQEGIAPKLLEKIRARMETLRVGDPLDKAVDIGAIIAPVQLDRINELVQIGAIEGAELYQPSSACPTTGWFYPPTLLWNVSPSATVAQVEIFGPVLVAMTFRTPDEAVELANNTVYGLAASVWTENLSRGLDIASRIKSGTVWVNCTNQFDAASGFGGYRESGYGREGGKEGLYEYIKFRSRRPKRIETFVPAAVIRVDQTLKHFIGGKQVRPDGGYSLEIPMGDAIQEVARGNRKDIRNAVEAARGAQAAWAKLSAHARAQILFYLAENLSARFDEFAALVGADEIESCIQRCFAYAGWCDKFDSHVHQTPMRGLTYTLNEAIGVIGVVAPNESPLLGMLSFVMPAIAMGNTVVILPSESAPVSAAQFYKVLDSSDLPAGVVNIVTGLHSEMETVLAEHDGVDAIWHFGSDEGSRDAEDLSAGNLKQTWTAHGHAVDWDSFEGREVLRHAVQVKNVWMPQGD